MSDLESISLHELLSKVKGAIQLSLPSNYWVRAEILAVKSTHYWRLELASYESENQEAKTSGIIWQSEKAIVQKFEKMTGSSLTVGLKVLIKCSVTFHHEYGLSLNIKDIDPRFSLGDMEANLNMIRGRLEELGEYSLNRNLMSPKEFTRVAVIAPNNAAGLGDFQSQAQALELHGLCSFVYHNALFQGNDSADSIINAMVAVNKENEHSNYDAVVIIRGGGDKAGIYQMNNLKIARGVCRLPIPVLVGIGHHQDSTILDELANQVFPTPSLVVIHIVDTVSSNAIKARANHAALEAQTKRILNAARNDTQGLNKNLALFAQQQLLVSNGSIRQFHKDLVEQPYKVLSTAKRDIDSSHASAIHGARLSINSQKQVTTQLNNSIWIGSKQSIKDANAHSQKVYREVVSDARSHISKALRNIQQAKSSLNASSVLHSSKREAEALYSSLIYKTRLSVIQQKQTIEQLTDALWKGGKQALKESNANSRKYHKELVSDARIILSKASGNTQRVNNDLKASSIRELNRLKQNNETIRKDLMTFAKQALITAKNKVGQNNDRVELLNPKNIIKRGFALVKSFDGKVITESSKLSRSDQVILQMRDGNKTAKIED